jgi:hypothetical protein
LVLLGFIWTELAVKLYVAPSASAGQIVPLSYGRGVGVRVSRDVAGPRASLTGGCDLVHFHDVGAVGLLLGPGSLDVAHQPDESVRRTISPAPPSSIATSPLR